MGLLEVFKLIVLYCHLLLASEALCVDDEFGQLDKIVEQVVEEKAEVESLSYDDWLNLFRELSSGIKSISRGESARIYKKKEVEACFELLQSNNPRVAYVASHLIAGHLVFDTPASELEAFNYVLFRKLFIDRFVNDKKFAKAFYRAFVSLGAGPVMMYGDGYSPSLYRYLATGFYSVSDEIEELEGAMVNTIQGQLKLTELKCLALLCNHALSFDAQNQRVATFEKVQLVEWSKQRLNWIDVIVFSAEFDAEQLRWKMNPMHGICYWVGFLYKCRFAILTRYFETIKMIESEFQRTPTVKFRAGLPDEDYRPFPNWRESDELFPPVIWPEWR